MTVIDRQTISYRPIRDDDREFLYQLYASTRADEMKMLSWNDAEKEQFVRMQFHAQSTDYANNYDTNQFFIIEQHGQPIGRLYFDRQPDDISIVDITLLAETRGAGLGTLLLQEILDEATRTGKSVSIHVEHFNPAMRLYQRLGFRHVATNGVYHLMRYDKDLQRFFSECVVLQRVHRLRKQWLAGKKERERLSLGRRAGAAAAARDRQRFDIGQLEVERTRILER